eukprot:6460611-Amphidinium_carterae.1
MLQYTCSASAGHKGQPIVQAIRQQAVESLCNSAWLVNMTHHCACVMSCTDHLGEGACRPRATLLRQALQSTPCLGLLDGGSGRAACI